MCHPTSSCRFEMWLATFSFLAIVPQLALATIGGAYTTAYYGPPLRPQWNRLFTDYLTQEVGANMSPPRNFSGVEAKYPGASTFDEAIAAGADFVFAPLVVGACTLAQHNALPLATLVNMAGEPWMGGVIFTRHDSPITEVREIKGKNIAAVYIWALEAWALQAERAEREGVHVLAEANKVTMFAGNAIPSVFQAVLDGSADVGFIGSKPYGPQMASGKFKVLGQLEFEGYSGPTSSPLVPGWFVGALPHVGHAERTAVTGALLRLGSNHSVAKALGLDGFVPAESYFSVLQTMERQNIVQYDANKERVCLNEVPHLYDIMQCPPGAFKKSEARVWSGCAELNETCPEGARCVCQPCLWSDMDVDLRPTNGLSHTDSACQRSSVCGDTYTGHSIGFEIRDFLLRDNVKVEAQLLHITEDNTLAPRSVLAQVDPLEPFAYSFALTIDNPGLFVLQVEFNGQQVSASPVYVKVSYPPCNPGRVRVGSACACGDGKMALGGGKCMLLAQLLPLILLPVLAALALCGALLVRYKLRAADGLWVIDPADLVFGDPPLLFGAGTYGWVIHAHYLGTDVAVKRFYPERLQQESEAMFRSESYACLAEEASRSRGFHTADSMSRMRMSRGKSTGEIEAVCPCPGPQSASLRTPTSPPLLPAVPASRLRPDWARIPSEDSQRPTPQSRPLSPAGRAESSAHAHRHAFASPRHSWSAKGGRSSSLSHASLHASLSGTPVKMLNPRRASLGLLERQIEAQAADGDASSLSRGAGTGLDLSPSRAAGYTSGGAGRVPSGGGAAHATSTSTASDRGRLAWCFGRRQQRSRARKEFVQEMRLLSRLRHPRITTVMGAVLKGNEIMMVMEVMDHGSLQDFYLNAMMEIDDEMAHTLLLDVVAGMDFLHSHKPPICHGDLKGGNILVDGQCRAKVSDFGMAGRKRRAAGTPLWSAPELLTGGPGSLAADVFAFAITMQELFVRGLPYNADDLATVLAAVADPDVDMRPEIPEGCGPALSTLMRKCWHRDPLARPSFAEVREAMLALDVREFSRIFKSNDTSRGQTQVQGADTHSILYSLFPQHVAEAMMRGEKPAEDRRECSTIFFSDIVGFTSQSSTMESHQVSELLDRLFNQFDDLAQQHGVYKLETIGDCYIAVTNLVQEQPEDHVRRIADFSIGAIEAARNTLIDPEDASKGHVVIRVGFDAGPVVGNVVGSKTKKYTVFGNTVNTASRMESTGIPDKIQCTQRAAKLLHEQDPSAVLLERGQVQVKGRGAMTTYILQGKTADGSAAAFTAPPAPRPLEFGAKAGEQGGSFKKVKPGILQRTGSPLSALKRDRLSAVSPAPSPLPAAARGRESLTPLVAPSPAV